LIFGKKIKNYRDQTGKKNMIKQHTQNRKQIIKIQIERNKNSIKESNVKGDGEMTYGRRNQWFW